MTTKLMSRLTGMLSFGWNKTGCVGAKYIELVYCVQARAEVLCDCLDRYHHSIHLKTFICRYLERVCWGQY